MSAREEVGSVGEDGERRKEEEKEFVEIERRGGRKVAANRACEKLRGQIRRSFF